MSSLPIGWLVIAGIVLICFALLFMSGAVVFIPNNKFGIIEKKWSFGGGESDNFMSKNGSPGFLYNVIVGGWHIFMPFQYKVHIDDLITVSEIGYLFSRIGNDLTPGQMLARWPEKDGRPVNIENAQNFVECGGQRGQQRNIIRGGSYAINTAVFAVITDDGVSMVGDDSREEIEEIYKKIKALDGFNPVIINEDSIGIVTVQDGPSLLNHVDTIAPTVGNSSDSGHNGFQNIEVFLKLGGRRGVQEQVLTEGTYYINRLFATVERGKKTIIPVGFVGVVNSCTGNFYKPVQKENATDMEILHNQIASVVPNGYRGIWEEPLRPGKYAYNPKAYEIQLVPTTNFQLRWEKGNPNSKDFDATLSEIKLITQDAFEPILPLTIVVSILPEDAPRVVQQFADVRTLVTDTLDPMLSAWFKDSAQKKTLLDLVQARAELQENASEVMSKRFRNYHLNVREVMIGTPRPSDNDKKMSEVLEQLRERQIARETTKTYEEQTKTAETKRSLNEAMATAEQQKTLTSSKINIAVAQNEAQGELERKKLEAESISVMAKADADRISTIAKADATRIESIGEAEAKSLKAQSDALGGPKAILTKTVTEIIMNNLTESGQPLVPQIVVSGENGQNGGVASALMAKLIAQTSPEMLDQPRTEDED